MLIGFSISRCISDIMEDKVNPDDVLLIIGRTYFDIGSMDSLIDGYQTLRGPWYDYDRGKLKSLLTTFWYEGRIHQPRRFGTQPPSMPRSKIWMRVILDQKDMPKPAQDAWDRFVVLASLYGAKSD
jgi:hypothetical protein